MVLNSVGKNNEKKEKKEKYLNKLVATFVYASSQGQRTHSARTKSLGLDLNLLPIPRNRQNIMNNETYPNLLKRLLTCSNLSNQSKLLPKCSHLSKPVQTVQIAHERKVPDCAQPECGIPQYKNRSFFMLQTQAYLFNQ